MSEVQPVTQPFMLPRPVAREVLGVPDPVMGSIAPYLLKVRILDYTLRYPLSYLETTRDSLHEAGKTVSKAATRDFAHTDIAREAAAAAMDHFDYLIDEATVDYRLSTNAVMDLLSVNRLTVSRWRTERAMPVEYQANNDRNPYMAAFISSIAFIEMCSWEGPALAEPTA